MLDPSEVSWRPQGDFLRFTQDKFTSCRPAQGAGSLRVQNHPGGTMQKEEGQLEYQLTLFFYLASLRGFEPLSPA